MLRCPQTQFPCESGLQEFTWGRVLLVPALLEQRWPERDLPCGSNPAGSKLAGGIGHAVLPPLALQIMSNLPGKGSTMPPNLTVELLQRRAVVYIRQSS
jgi:hypothetical protein